MRLSYDPLHEPAHQAARAHKDAVRAVIARHRRTGAWRCTGEELQALRLAVSYSDQVLPLLRTDQLTAALVTVNAAMDRLAATEATT
jgi:hypothetical protein